MCIQMNFVAPTFCMHTEISVNMDLTYVATHGLSWKQFLNNYLGVINLSKHWRHYYRATTAGTALPYKP